MDTPANYHFSIGEFKCIAISDGIETRPVTSVFKDVPIDLLNQALQDGGYSTSESIIYFNNLFIQAGQLRVLVDAGWGKGSQRRDGALLEALQTEGIQPGDIDLIIITHGDVDHIGGILSPDNRVVFPKSEYILPKDAWDFWSNEALVARWPEYLTTFGRKTLPFIRDRVKVVKAGAEFLPGFKLAPAPGHRPGHAALIISSSGEQILHLADTIGHPVLMEHPAWSWYADFKPEQATEDKASLLGQAAAQQMLVFASHLPFPGVGRVTPLGEGWRWHPL